MLGIASFSYYFVHGSGSVGFGIMEFILFNKTYEFMYFGDATSFFFSSEATVVTHATELLLTLFDFTQLAKIQHTSTLFITGRNWILLTCTKKIQDQIGC